MDSRTNVNRSTNMSSKPKIGLLAAASIGSFIDWYVFLLTSIAAALVFPTVFFSSSLPPSVALVSSFASIVAIPYISRFAGGVIFGHYGDRIGRRSTLFITLMVAVITSVAIGLLPSYAAAGYLGLSLLILLRIIYGIGIGGEYGVATTWVGEQANKLKRRTFWAQMPIQMVPFGIGVAFLTFAVLLGYTSHSFFITTGWRYAYYFSAILALVGLIIRFFYSESSVFKEMAAKKVERVPIVPLFKHNFKKIFVIPLTMMLNLAGSTIIIIPYAQDKVIGAAIRGGGSAATALLYLGVAAILSFIPASLFYVLADRIGRANMILVSNVMLAVFVFPFVYIIEHTLSLPILAADVFVLFSIIFTYSAAISAFFIESFDTKYRASGVGITYQMASIYTGVVVGVIVPPIVLSVGGYNFAGQALAWVIVALAILGVLVSIFTRRFDVKTLKRDLATEEK